MKLRRLLVIATLLAASATGVHAQAAAPWALLVEPSATPWLTPTIDLDALAERERLLIAPRWQGGQGPLRASLEFDAHHGAGLLCRSGFGVTSAFSHLAAHCLDLQLGEVDPLLDAARRAPASVGLNVGWVLPQEALQIGLNIRQLQMDAEFVAAPFALSEAATAAALELRGEVAEAQLTHWWGERNWLRVTAGQQRLRASAPWAGNLQWSQSALQVDGGLGAFSGVLRGHRNSSPLVDQRWSDIDLGVSWRTPWAGRITIGARNVLGNVPDSDDQAVKEALDAESRTPYVRYQQDL